MKITLVIYQQDLVNLLLALIHRLATKPLNLGKETIFNS